MGEVKHMNRLRDIYFWSALLIVLATIYLMVATYLRWFLLHFTLDLFIGSFYIHHWFSWIGTLFIAVFTPAYYILKRRYAKRFRTLLKLHVFGNLLAVMLVSIHFTQQISRPPQFYPDLGTGIVLYAAMIILVATGFLQRFQFAKSLGRYWRFIHNSVTVTFYLIIIVHILHGLEIL